MEFLKPRNKEWPRSDLCFKYCYRELRKVFVWSPRRLEVTADFIGAVVTEQGSAWLKKCWGEPCRLWKLTECGC